MPQVSFSSEHRATSSFDYPKLQLETSQKALVLMFERSPLLEFVHTLQMPELGPDGRAIYETTMQWGKEVTRPRMQFVGKSICLGDDDVLMEKGSDPKNCPVCAEAKKSDIVKFPERRYAAHIAHYSTSPGTFNVTEPFNVSIKAWVFGGKVFDKLVDIAEEWDDLHKHDLKLGPCESKQYQKFDIAVSQQAEWLKSEERQQTLATAFKNNQSSDLSVLIARRNSLAQVEEDLEKVKRTSAQAFGKGEVADVPSVSEISSNLDLDGLLGQSSQPTPEQQAKPAPQEEAQQPASTKEKTVDVPDLDSLLQGS